MKKRVSCQVPVLNSILEFSGFGVYENIKRQFINVVPIKAYIRKLFFKSRLRSWSGFVSCSNFRINILGKDALDLYGLVFKIEFNLIIPQKSFTTFGSTRCQGFSPLSW